MWLTEKFASNKKKDKKIKRKNGHMVIGGFLKVTVIALGNGIGDPCSNPERD